MPQFLVLTIGWYVNSWWRMEEPNLNCTADERESVVQSSLAILDDFLLFETGDIDISTTPGIVGRIIIIKL